MSKTLRERIPHSLMAGGVVFAMVLGLVAASDDPSVFGRMLAIDAVSLAAGFAAWRMGWRRWLMAAPFVTVGWVALACWAAACPLVQGRSGWLVLGPVTIDVWAYFPLAFGLMAGWLAARLRMKARWTCLILAVAFQFWTVGRIVTNENRRERVRTFLRGGSSKTAEPSPLDYQHEWCVKAMETAKPFGRSELDIADMPCKRTSSLPAAATSRFGSWFFVLLSFAFTLFFAGVVARTRQLATSPQRAFAAVAFVAIGFKALNGLLCGTHLLPFFGWSLPFATIAGSATLATSLVVGVLLGVEKRV